jgi:hypothetical protein
VTVRSAMAWGARARVSLALAAIVVLAIVLRLQHAANAMVYDEMASMYFSSQPWSHLWGWWMVRETNPPLFYSLLKLWRDLVPMGHWWMRALPLLIAGVHLVLFGRFVRARLGWPAALASLLLFAVSWSDIYQAAYLRGYVLAELGVLVSFIGLLDAIEREGAAARSGWALYGLGATVAIYSHTTMLLWPVIVTIAVMADAAIQRQFRWRQVAALIAANLAILAASGWVVAVTLAQLHGRTANIAWLEPLTWNDYLGKIDLQLFAYETWGAVSMLLLVLIGTWRAWRQRVVRLSFFVVIGTLVLFRLAEAVHPIVSDFTMHWCFSFTALLAGAALPATWRGARWRASLAYLILAVATYYAADSSGATGIPQDWRYIVRTVARDRGAAMLASHESMGVVIEQVCLVEFGRTPCPFPLVVMADPHPTDNWAAGGYHGRLVAPGQVRAAIGRAPRVYAFSRYYYTPLEHLGMPRDRWFQAMWDDGELIGPIPASAFDAAHAGAPDYNAQYNGIDD